MIRRLGMLMSLVVPTAALVAQSANDVPKTLIGVSFGVLPGGSLWEVPNQPITAISTPPNPTSHYPPDVVDLRRDLQPRRPVLSVHGTRFVNSHLGYTAEFDYLAFQTTDACTVVQHGGDPALGAVCDSIPVTSQGPRATTVLQAGLILRPLSGSVLQPYVEGLAGFASTASSTATLTSTVGHAAGAGGSAPLIVNIYQDPRGNTLRPTWTLAAGLATAATQGLQVHVELRDSWIAQSIVTGATQGQGHGEVTPIQSTFRGFMSVLFGFDVVLAKQRGKRY